MIVEKLLPTDSLDEAEYIKFKESHNLLGITGEKIYKIVNGIIDGQIGLEPYIIDDYGRANVAAIISLKSELYKTT